MASQTKISIQDLHLHYGDFEALKGITMEIPSHEITAFIGPSGCGKSTCIKTLNRMNDLIPNCRITGNVSIDGEDIYDPRTDVTLLRRRAGMVFQKPNPFPMSVYDNIAYGPRVHGIKSKRSLTNWWNALCGGPPSGTRWGIGCTNPPWACRVGSSSGCASPAPWRWNRTSCSWMNPPPRSTPSPPSKSRI